MNGSSRTLTAAAVLSLLAASTGCSGGREGRLDHGTVFPADSTRLAVAPGQTFSLHWDLDVVPGNDWKVSTPSPDPAVVSQVGEDRIPAGDGGRSGDGGQLYLVFKAGLRKGSADLVLENCWTCTGALRQTYHSRRTYRIVVGG